MSLFTKLTKKLKSKSDTSLEPNKITRTKTELNLDQNLHPKQPPDINCMNQLRLSGFISTNIPAIFILRSPENLIYLAVKHYDGNDKYTCLSQQNLRPEILNVTPQWKIHPFDFNIFKQMYSIECYQLLHSDNSIEWVYVLRLLCEHVILSGKNTGRIICNCPIYYDPSACVAPES